MLVHVPPAFCLQACLSIHEQLVSVKYQVSIHSTDNMLSVISQNYIILMTLK